MFYIMLLSTQIPNFNEIGAFLIFFFIQTSKGGKDVKGGGGFGSRFKRTKETKLYRWCKIHVSFTKCNLVSDFVPSRKDWKFAERITRKGKLKWAIFKFQSFKSAGLDGVFPALLKEGFDLLLSRLTSIFKSSVALGFIPKLWEKVRVAFIPKPGKTTHTE